MNHETDLISTTLFLILYYLAVITLLILGGVTYTPAADTGVLLPSAAPASDTPFEMGAKLLSLLPTVCICLLLLLSPVIICIKTAISCASRTNLREDLRKDSLNTTLPLAILAFTGILLPHITSLTAHFIGHSIGMAHLIPEITIHAQAVSACTCIAVGGWLVPLLFGLVLDIREHSRREETEEP